MTSYRFNQGARYRFDRPKDSLLSLLDEHVHDPTVRDRLKAGWQAMDEALAIREIIGYREFAANRNEGT